jgi:hypothetical protein
MIHNTPWNQSTEPLVFLKEGARGRGQICRLDLDGSGHHVNELKNRSLLMPTPHEATAFASKVVVPLAMTESLVQNSVSSIL